MNDVATSAMVCEWRSQSLRKRDCGLPKGTVRAAAFEGHAQPHPFPRREIFRSGEQFFR